MKAGLRLRTSGFGLQASDFRIQARRPLPPPQNAVWPRLAPPPTHPGGRLPPDPHHDAALHGHGPATDWSTPAPSCARSSMQWCRVRAAGTTGRAHGSRDRTEQRTTRWGWATCATTNGDVVNRISQIDHGVARDLGAKGEGWIRTPGNLQCNWADGSKLHVRLACPEDPLVGGMPLEVASRCTSPGNTPVSPSQRAPRDACVVACRRVPVTRKDVGRQ